MQKYLRKYGEATTIDFVLFGTDGIDFKTDAEHAAGDTKIMKNEGDEANTTNAFVDEGQGYSLTLTAAEMQAARVVLYVVDQGTKAWLDTALIIETYGHASAQHAFNPEKAVKMLVNKAVQNKATGATVYYDDDGETPILTLTPTDSETDITRASS